MELIPLRPALPHGRNLVLPVLMQHLPKGFVSDTEEPDLDLALVLDRSSSMSGAPIEAARTAACAAVSSMRHTDRICVVIYDHEVDVLVPLQELTEKTPIIERIRLVTIRGSTALFAGWEAGARQLLTENKSRVRRVILLTDGEANVGLVEPDKIASRVSGYHKQGIYTTTMGFGQAYNENLLRSMAASGNGNHYYVENPGQLLDFFKLELAGLEATIGSSVGLEIAGSHPEVEAKLLSPLPIREEGGWQLSDMLVGCPLSLMFTLQINNIPEDMVGSNMELLRMRLSWTRPREGIQEEEETILSLPIVARSEWETMPENGQVNEQMVVYDVAIAQEKASKALSLGDPTKAIEALEEGLRRLRESSKSGDASQLTRRLEDQVNQVMCGSYSHASKSMTADSYGSFSSVSLSGTHLKINKMMKRIEQLNDMPINITLKNLMPLGAIATSGQKASRERVRAMLLGVAIGEALGSTLKGKEPGERKEAGDLNPGGSPGPHTLQTFRSLAAIVQQRNRNPEIIAAALASDPAIEAGDSFNKFLRNYKKEGELERAGVEEADNSALVRVAAAVTARVNHPGLMALNAALCTGITHRDNAAITSGVAFAWMLWDLLHMVSSPDSDWWWKRFAHILHTFEDDSRYYASGSKTSVRLSKWVLEKLDDGWKRDLSTKEACAEWGSGTYLLETIPSMLYILSRHGTEPEKAVIRAVSDTIDPGTIGAAVGAAVGALHGPAAFRQEWLDNHGLAGDVLDTIDRALKMFCK